MAPTGVYQDHAEFLVQAMRNAQLTTIAAGPHVFRKSPVVALVMPTINVDLGSVQAARALNPPVAEPAMGKPPSKASEGGRVDILRKQEDATQSEVLKVFGKWVAIRLKVRPEAPPPAGFTHVHLVKLSATLR